MVSATPRISNATLAGMLRGGRFTLGNRIVVSFGVLLVLMLVMAAISYTRLQNIDQEAFSLQRDSVPGLFLATSMRAATRNSYAELERALFVDSDAESIKEDLEHTAENLRQLSKRSTDYEASIFRDDDRERYRAFRAAADKYVALINESMELAHTSKPAAQAVAVRAVSLWKASTALADGLVADNHARADESAQQIQNAVRTTEITLATALGFVLLAALVLGYALFRAVTVPMARLVEVHDSMRTGDLTQRLDLHRTDEFGTLEEGFNRMSEELTALVSQAQKSSLQVTTSVAEIAATSKEQQATAAETAATTTEIGATSRDLLRTMNEVSGVAEQSATLAGASQSGLTRMEDTMRGVMEAAGSVNAKLAILNEKATNINQVVSTITKVADQTNLLSLNAAIEAEKAGEYGRGFAVVATEIRRLADQTAVATYDIEQTVKEIQSAVSAGVMGMDKFSEEVRRGMRDVQQVGGQLSQIIAEVQALAPRFQMVNEGMQTQATGAEQITQALSQLSEAAQQTAESLRQSSQAIDDLTLVANQLRTGVSRFKLEA
jgi:methyl-accepting chemotaxis protein WspA